jgi:hypothetical protein
MAIDSTGCPSRYPASLSGAACWLGAIPVRVSSGSSRASACGISGGGRSCPP